MGNGVGSGYGGPLIKRVGSGHSRPVNKVGRVGLLVQLNGSVRVSPLITRFKMERTYTKKIYMMIIVIYKSLVVSLTNYN